MRLFHRLLGRSTRSIGGAFSLSGRATLWDLIVLNLVLGLASGIAGLFVRDLSFEQRWTAETVIGLILIIPALAGYVRRFHDMNASGWWVLVLLPLVPWNFYRSYRVNFTALNPEWLNQPDPMAGLGWWLVPSGIALLMVLFMPGTRGANPHGPDPRERTQPKSARVAASTSA